jgi:uncharacterized protein (DUF362 family)/NAD-dependent dihydropyrimidine dehydrogenase PreA subunit
MPTIAVAKCEDYNLSTIEKALDHCLDGLGGISQFIDPGDKVVIKPNFISKKKPEEAATTHPAVIRAVVQAVKQAGGIPIIAESPGGPYTASILKKIYETCGSIEVSKQTGCELNYDTSSREVEYSGIKKRKFSILTPILEADKVISLAKLKTHTMTAYTGVVKNLFGSIPGLNKTQHHFELQEKEAFCAMLLDLCECVKPTLSILDAVWGMEGNGPTSGTPRKVGALLVSENPYSLDLAASSLIGFEPDEIETVRQSLDLGLTPPYSNLSFVGDSIESFRVSDYKRARGSEIHFLRKISLPEPIVKKIDSMAQARPKIQKKQCIGCGECARCCPPKAIVIQNHLAKIDQKLCIHCFCCQELCPQKAVEARRNPIFEKFFSI